MALTPTQRAARARKGAATRARIRAAQEAANNNGAPDDAIDLDNPSPTLEELQVRQLQANIDAKAVRAA
jgi:hypothetical protein